MKLDKRHMRLSLALMVGAVTYNVWAFTATGKKAVVPQPTAPIQALASGQPPPGSGGRIDPSQVKALPDVAPDRVPVWPRNPFQDPHPPEVVEVVEEAPPPPPTPEPDPVVASILYSPDRKAAVVDGHIVRIGDAIGASQVVDILPKAVIVDSPERGRRTLGLKPPSGAAARK